MSAGQILAAALGPSEARRLTDEVKRDAQALWTKLLRLYEGGAHQALNYPSWAAYCEAEFEIGKSHAYRLLEAGHVLAALEAHSPMGDSVGLNERQARELAQVGRDHGPEAVAAVYVKARERSKGKIEAATIREFAAELLPPACEPAAAPQTPLVRSATCPECGAEVPLP
jgi:hypothetical protein